MCPSICCIKLLAGLNCYIVLTCGEHNLCSGSEILILNQQHTLASTIVNRLLRSLLPGSEKLSILYEQWIECAGHWTESTLLQQLKYEKRHRRIGARKWLTYAELVMKYGNAECARKICESKRRDLDVAKKEIRSHPDCPGDSVSLFQFRAVWIRSISIVSDVLCIVIYWQLMEPIQWTDQTLYSGI